MTVRVAVLGAHGEHAGMSRASVHPAAPWCPAQLKWPCAHCAWGRGGRYAFCMDAYAAASPVGSCDKPLPFCRPESILGAGWGERKGSAMTRYYTETLARETTNGPPLEGPRIPARRPIVHTQCSSAIAHHGIRGPSELGIESNMSRRTRTGG